MDNIKKNIFVWIVILTIVNQFWGMPTYYFKQLTTKQGLSQSTILSMVQDHHGFMWFGTMDGLNRFDGYTIKVYRNEFNDSSGLKNNRITDLKVDDQGNLWIAHDLGIQVFNFETNQFKYFKHPQKTELMASQIELIDNDQLLVNTLDSLYLLDTRSGQYSSIKDLPFFPLKIKKIKNKIYLIGRDKISLWQNNKIKSYLDFHDEKLNLIDLIIEKGTIYLLADHQFLKYQLENNLQTDLTKKLIQGSRLNGLKFTEFIKSTTGKIWIGSTQGLFIYDPNNQSFKRISTAINSNLSSKNITKLYENDTRILWVGTFDRGINYLDIQHGSFCNILPEMRGKKVLSNRLVYALLPEEDDRIWVGTDDGLDLIDLKNNRAIHFTSENKIQLSNNRIRALLKDDKNHLWIGTYDGLNVLNLNNQTVKVFKPYPNLEKNVVIDIHALNDNQLLVGLKLSGLFLFDKRNNKFDMATLKDDSSNQSSWLFITDIKRDKWGKIYVATYGHGLLQYLPKENQLRPILLDNRCRYLYCVFPEDSNIIWLGTYGEGLFLFQPQKDVLINLSMKNGLPNNVVYGILKDKQNNYWVSTNKGLCLVNYEGGREPNLKVRRIFDYSDGLPDNEFNFGAYCETKKGWLYWGTVNGFTYFNPQNFKINKKPPKVFISGIKVNHQPLAQIFPSKKRESFWRRRQIHLENDQNTIEFDFTALHYTNPAKNVFAYRLVGFEEDWNYTSASHRVALYRQLKGGNYEFQVKAANADGIWSSDIATFDILIDKPYWQQTWFKIGLLFFVLAIGYIFHLLKTIRIRERNKLLNEFNRKLRMENEQKKQVMTSLKETLEKFKTIFENVPLGIFYVDANANLTEMNENFIKILGSSYEKLLGLNFFKDLKDEALKQAVRDALKGKTGYYEGKYITVTSNKVVPVRTVIRGIHSLDGEIVGAVGIVEDLTDIEFERLKESVIKNITQAVITTEDLESFYEIFHKELSKIINTKNLFVALYDSQRQIFTFPLMKDEMDDFDSVPAKGTLSYYVIQKGKSCLFTEKEMLALEEQGVIDRVGTPAKCWLGIPLKIENQIIGILVVQDYERDDAFTEETLKLLELLGSSLAASINQKQNRQKISLLTKGVAQSSLSLMIADRKGGLVYRDLQNNSDIFPESANLKEILKYRLEGDGSFIDRCIENGQKWNGEVIRKLSENQIRWEFLSINPVFNENNQITHFVVVIEDITESKKLKDQLQQAQKIESIGTLAGGIAHDFNNLLTVINGHAEIALLKLNQNKKIHSDIVSILHAGKRAANLTRQLLAFSRKQIYKAELLDINQTVQSMEKMLRRLIGEDIIIEIELAPNLPLIKADPSQLEQVLLNLVVNARDALREWDKRDHKKPKIIRIKTEKTIIDREAHLLDEPLGGTYIQISVSDTGIGMDEETKNRVFEPFFTTKEVGKGTGLGLSTVYGIVKQNKGFIEIESEPGQGTTFKIYWPVEMTEKPANKAEEDSEKIVSGKGKVLVVEDDESVREFIKDILEHSGYTVHYATNGQQAAEYLQELQSEKLDLVITDMIMPEMNGNELAELIQRTHPEAKILFISGYTDTNIIHEQLSKEGTLFLNKPFTIVELTQTVKKLLGE